MTDLIMPVWTLYCVRENKNKKVQLVTICQFIK